MLYVERARDCGMRRHRKLEGVKLTCVHRPCIYTYWVSLESARSAESNGVAYVKVQIQIAAHDIIEDQGRRAELTQAGGRVLGGGGCVWGGCFWV